MPFEDILVEKRDAWIEIQINRPDKMNALREQTAREILEALGDAEHDRAIRVILLKGNERFFCSGVDTSEFQILDNEYFDFYRQRKRSRQINRLFREAGEVTKPIISAIEGYALGGGLELALVGDIIVAGEKAQFGLPEVRLGLMPGGGGTQTLPRLIGKALAKELIWTGRRISAVEAKEFRLVNHVTPAGEAEEKAREIAASIAKNAPLPVMLTKSAIDHGTEMSLSNGFAAEGDASFLLYFTRDRKEGLAAFREKRPPEFLGE